MIYLASQSPRRQDLLRQIGVAFTLLLPQGVEEIAAAEALEALLPHEKAKDYVVRAAQNKLAFFSRLAQQRGLERRPILCADTTVAIDGMILGKPASESENATMLRSLSGKTHQVYTAIACAELTALSTSQVTFAPLNETEIAAYCASGEGMGKAGGYGIQGAAAAFISHIAGSYSGIMGLPLYETQILLKAV